MLKDTEITQNVLNHTEKFAVLLISFVPRIFSDGVTLYFQCHNFIVNLFSQSSVTLTLYNINIAHVFT